MLFIWSKAQCCGRRQGTVYRTRNNSEDALRTCTMDYYVAGLQLFWKALCLRRKWKQIKYWFSLPDFHSLSKDCCWRALSWDKYLVFLLEEIPFKVLRRLSHSVEFPAPLRKHLRQVHPQTFSQHSCHWKSSGSQASGKENKTENTLELKKQKPKMGYKELSEVCLNSVYLISNATKANSH